jgi:predicted amidophosphoribosyltransferase
MKNPVTPRRCKHCGAIGVTPHPDGSCDKCTAKIAKIGGK